MTTIFSRIIAREIPGRFVYEDDLCVAFLTAGPLTDGHTLVVPREEIEEWTQTPPAVLSHLMEVARVVGRAQQQEWSSPRVGLLLQGFEVPHVHVHVWPAFSPADFDLRRAQGDPDPTAMDEAARRLRARLRLDDDAAGHVPDDPA